MNARIIYTNNDGSLGVIIPTPEAIALIGVLGIAAKDVPAGRPYAIVDAVDVPSDRSQRAAWAVNEAELNDGIGADYGAGSDNDVIALAAATLFLRNRITGQLSTATIPTSPSV